MRYLYSPATDSLFLNILQKSLAKSSRVSTHVQFIYVYVRLLWATAASSTRK